MHCKVTGKLFEILRKVWEEQKLPREYNGQLLYHAEAGFLEVIHQFPQAKVSDMSNILRITKGAVTQLSTKLSQKNLIEIYLKNGNKKEKYFRLTEEGEGVRLQHLKFHELSNRNLCDYFKTLDEDQSKTIFDFLNHLKDCIPFCEFDCICTSQNEERKGSKNESDTVKYSSTTCHS